MGNIFGSDRFLPHGHCYLWKPELLWLHVVSDSVIALSYVSITITLFYFIRKSRKVPFSWVFAAFGIFISACGVTHIMAVWNIWFPTYWLSGEVKLITALVSIVTAVLLFPLIPKALALPSPTDLMEANKKLLKEIDSRKRVEETLKRSRDELEAFSYSVSHDLRAPLRAMDGFSQALMEDYEDKLDNEGKDYLRDIRDSAVEMGSLIESLLRLSKISRKELIKEQVNMSDLARGVMEIFQINQPERKVDFVIEERLAARGDKDLIHSVLQNLLGNAWKFTSKRLDAKIEFGSIQENGETVYYVRDNGVGFNMAYADKMFGAFQRLHSKSEFEGTGIGLANAQRIINRHSGRIWAKGEEGKGATFYFTL